jgi:hypothetical protein
MAANAIHGSAISKGGSARSTWSQMNTPSHPAVSAATAASTSPRGSENGPTGGISSACFTYGDYQQADGGVSVDTTGVIASITAHIWAGGKNCREFVVGRTMLGRTVEVALRNTIMWLVGIVLAVLAAGLMVWSDIGDGPLMVMGMLGILFIAVGARGRRSQHR